VHLLLSLARLLPQLWKTGNHASQTAGR